MKFEELLQIQSFDTTYMRTFEMNAITNMAELSTDKMTMHRAYIGLAPSCHNYGRIIGIFEYRGQFFRFWFHVHTPKQKNPNRSNKLTSIEKLCVKTTCGIQYVNAEDTDMGRYAVCYPLSKLQNMDEDSYELRKLMDKICAYSRRQNYCKILRHTDKARLAYMTRPTQPSYNA